MSLSGLVIKNSAATMVAQATIKILSFGFSVLVVRHLGAEQFGQYAAVLAFGATFVFLADLGLGAYVVRAVSRLRADVTDLPQIPNLLGNTIALRLILATAAAVLLVFMAWLSDRPPAMLVALAIGGAGLIVFGIQGACESVLAGYERLDIAAFAKIANQVVFVVLGAGALALGSSYHGLVVASFLGACVMTALCWYGLARLSVRPARPQLRTWAPLLRSSAPFAVIAGTLGLSYKLDSVLLNLWWGDAETGHYNAAYALVLASVFFSNSLNTALFPTLSRQVKTTPAILPQIMANALRYLLLVSLPIAIGGWALADRVVALLYGADFGPTGVALAILVWVVPLMFVSEFLGYVVVVRGAEKRVARSVLISTGVNVACNVALVPWLGLTAAAIMTVVTEAVLVVQYLFYLRAPLAQLPWGRVLLRPLGAALAMGSVVYVLRDLPVVAAIGAGAVVYLLLVLALGAIGRDDLRAALSAIMSARYSIRASSAA